ncbi:MAG TPA: ribonuclease P protein component [Parachlamydiales bacterium]|nr:ribonuclease P protein component [Parachlamydiales bacterium]
MRHETHIPAQQTKTEEDTRIPRPHEDSRRPQGHQAPSSSRPQETGCLKLPRGLSFPKEVRLRKRHEFLALQKRGQRAVGKRICLDYQLASSDMPRLGITASSKYGNAPERSRFKRLVREVFRKHFTLFPPHIQINVLPRQRAKEASEEEIRLELFSLIHSIAKESLYAQS